MAFDAKALKHFSTGEEAAQFVVGEVVKACNQSIANHGVFHWVLAGGSTPELCYRMLKDADMDWSKVQCGLVMNAHWSLVMLTAMRRWQERRC